MRFYKLVTAGPDTEEICVDGCVYTRSNASHAGEEYCFKNEDIGGVMECQVEFSDNDQS